MKILKTKFNGLLGEVSGLFFIYVLYVTFTEGEKVSGNYWAKEFQK